MLEDRSYMQNSPLDSRRSVTVTLLIVLVIVYVVQSCLMLYGGLPLVDWFALSVDGISHRRLWQILTFQFMHDAPLPFHLLFNCLGLWFFGRAVEEAVGRIGFLKLYFLSGFFGGGLQLLTTWLLPHHLDAPVVGASAGVMGLIAAFATLFPMREITLWLYFFPITLRAQYFFWFCLLISAYGTLVPFGSMAHAAHLGGILMGLAYIKWGVNAAAGFNWRPFRARPRPRELVKATAQKPAPWQRRRAGGEQDLPPAEFISREVDPILDKISAHGIQSLTDRERKILEAARAKMARR